MKISNIYKKYDNRVVLDIDSITFESGKIYALIGPNGSGKSTLGKLLSGIIKNDKNLLIEDPLTISYMPQKNFPFELSLYKNVLINSKDESKANFYIDKLNLKELVKTNAKKLSGGELAKVCLTRTLLNNSQLTILDEPTSSMDITSLINSEEIIKQYQQETGSTIILISHSFSQVKRIADSVIFLNEGKIIEIASPKEIENSKDPVILKFIQLFSK